jgi:hypothetical protein
MKNCFTLEHENTRRRAKPGGRRRGTVEVLPGPDCWNEHPWRLVRVALEPEANRLRPEGLSLSTAFGGMTASITICKLQRKTTDDIVDKRRKLL